MTRDTYKYHFKLGNKTVHTGTTVDLDRREQQHKRKFGESGHIKKGRNALPLETQRWNGKGSKRSADNLQQGIRGRFDGWFAEHAVCLVAN